jgi:hypothetical protein
MVWEVSLTSQAQSFIDGLDDDDKRAVLGTIRLLQDRGPQLGRPYADVLSTSRHSNLKELRVHRSGKEFRILFAFDSNRKAILLTGGDKLAHPGGQDAFYRRFIPEADDLLDAHLAQLQNERSESKAVKKSVAKRTKGKKK